MDLRLVLAASSTCRGPEGAFDIGGWERGGLSSPAGPGVKAEAPPARWQCQKSEILVSPCAVRPNCWWSPTFHQIVLPGS